MGCTTAANNQGINPKVAKYRFSRKEIKSGMNKLNEIGFGYFNRKEIKLVGNR
jgi:hypothetical protein